MTYSDIYKKFLIQYDKADVISSYPSLTRTEVATMLDKAYLAVIAQKFTGVNQRGAEFESDSKAIEDIRSLLTTTTKQYYLSTNDGVTKNSVQVLLPDDMLYYITSRLNIYDAEKLSNVILTSHQNAQNFILTDSNIPWIKTPVAYIEGLYLIILYDINKFDKNIFKKICQITYIKKPTSFANNINTWDQCLFELPDSVAEEVITLAKIFALENVESTRLNASVQTKSFEL